MPTTTHRTAVISGGASGLGAEIARELAGNGWQVIIACRNTDQGERVAASFDGATGGVRRATVMQLDTANPASIRAFAETYLRTRGELDVLINNAGAIYPDRRTGPGGAELTFATNVLGYHLLAAELLPALRRAAAARVVNVASTFAFGLDLDDLQFERRPYDGMAAYAQSKACDRLLTYALARRLSGAGITCNALAPGLMLATDLYRRLPAATRQQLEQYEHVSVRDGADTAVWLATSPEIAGVSGRFFERRTEVDCEFRQQDAEERLWTECERRARQTVGAGGIS
jgi:NAD(P)-dependent dehydrogenase (short-subunit alcohol dehydrogenase family)